MESLIHSLRDQFARAFRFFRNHQEVAERQGVEQYLADGVIRQQHDPDNALWEARRAQPLNAADSDLSTAQRMFDELGQRAQDSTRDAAFRDVQRHAEGLEARMRELRALEQQIRRQQGQDRGL